jgi:hypothetical protein
MGQCMRLRSPWECRRLGLESRLQAVSAPGRPKAKPISKTRSEKIPWSDVETKDAKGGKVVVPKSSASGDDNVPTPRYNYL